MKLKKIDFNKIDPNSLSEFLEVCCNACDSIDNHCKSTRLVSYLKKPKSASLESRLSTRKIFTPGQHDERLSLFVKVVNYLLRTYSTGNIIARKIIKIEF